MQKQLLYLLFFISFLARSQTYSGTVGPIPDNNTYVSFTATVNGLSPAQINQAGFGLESVCFDITHTWDSDLEILLQSPNGAYITLINGIGGSDDNFSNTCLDGASAPIGTASAPFTGTFSPMGALYSFNNGQNGNGTWTLYIRDMAAGDQGTLNSWSLSFGNNPAAPLGLDSSDIPIVVINTANVTIPSGTKITADMGIIDNGPGIRNYITDPFTGYNGKIGIEERGQSSAGFPQKQYNVETRDLSGNNLNFPAFGMPSNNDWVLYAPYNDKTLMRNVLAYKLSRDLGHWASRTRFCEVVLNGNYQGVYVFMEKIRRDSLRVPVPKLNSSDISGDAVTGGYIFSSDKGDTQWNSPYPPLGSSGGQTISFQYIYPKPTSVVSQQETYLQAYVDSFETALSGPNFQDPVNGYRKYASLKSFVDFFIVNETSRNVDGYRLSTYLYKDRYSKGGQLKAGPVWDFNLGFHNANYCSGELTTGWAYQFNNDCPGDNWQVPFWWERMMQDSAFKTKLYCKWQELRSPGGLLDTVIFFNNIDSIVAEVNESQQRHFTTWPILGIYTWPNPSPLPTTYAGEIRSMKDWIVQRFNWIDANITVAGPCSVTGIKSNAAKEEFSVNPNPFSNSIEIGFPTVGKKYKIELVNNLGQTEGILHEGLINESKVHFDTDKLQLSAGLYFLKISWDAGFVIKKLIRE
ncbi:MAG: CotH kinase family protein [Bacteroidia bacterium]